LAETCFLPSWTISSGSPVRRASQSRCPSGPAASRAIYESASLRGWPPVGREICSHLILRLAPRHVHMARAPAARQHVVKELLQVRLPVHLRSLRANLSLTARVALPRVRSQLRRSSSRSTLARDRIRNGRWQLTQPFVTCYHGSIVASRSI
jgi:hypothetical protein